MYLVTKMLCLFVLHIARKEKLIWRQNELEHIMSYSLQNIPQGARSNMPA